MGFVACDGASLQASIQVRLTAIAYNLKRTLNIITAATA